MATTDSTNETSEVTTVAATVTNSGGTPPNDDNNNNNNNNTNQATTVVPPVHPPHMVKWLHILEIEIAVINLVKELMGTFVSPMASEMIVKVLTDVVTIEKETIGVSPDQIITFEYKGSSHTILPDEDHKMLLLSQTDGKQKQFAFKSPVHLALHLTDLR
jgi:hypothetical protein